MKYVNEKIATICIFLVVQIDRRCIVHIKKLQSLFLHQFIFGTIYTVPPIMTFPSRREKDRRYGVRR